jgi:hypothetical protein
VLHASFPLLLAYDRNVKAWHTLVENPCQGPAYGADREAGGSSATGRTAHQ